MPIDGTQHRSRGGIDWRVKLKAKDAVETKVVGVPLAGPDRGGACARGYRPRANALGRGFEQPPPRACRQGAQGPLAEDEDHVSGSSRVFLQNHRSRK